MTTIEMVLWILIRRVEHKLWDDSTAEDIVAFNGDIVGSSVTEYHRVNDTYIKYTLTDSERDVDVDPTFTIIMMDGEDLACSIRIEFKKMDTEMIHNLDISSININGVNMDLDEIDSTSKRNIENTIMSLTQLL